MRKKVITALLTLLPLGMAAQGLQGSWSGQLDVGAAKLTLVLHVAPDGCTLDSPDQGAKDIECQTVFLSEDSISLNVPPIAATYNGKLVADELCGVFKQMGYPLKLDMKRGEVKRNRPQMPQSPSPYPTEEVTFTNGDITLAGTLTAPRLNPTNCCVVMVSGSGLQNRDEELFEHKPFAVLADRLARQGIASLRYDDRGFGQSTGDAANATTPDFCTDAATAIEYAREKGFKHVGIIGHSEGGSIAFMLAAQQKPDFIVTLAAPGLRGDSIIVCQNYDLARLSGQPVTYEQCEALLPTIRQQMAGNPWYMWFLDYDPANDIAHIDCPVLILNGEKDTQVNAGRNLAAICKHLRQSAGVDAERATIKAYPDLNHLFQHCTTGLPTEYGQIEETFAEEVISDIAEWILRRTK